VSAASDHYDALETRDPAAREADLFARLPGVLRKAMQAPAYAERLRGIDPAAVASRAALAQLSVLRKSELPALHKAAPPFGGFVAASPGSFARLFTSPGPIFEPEGAQADPWRGARALFAVGFRPGDVVLNTFSYHLTPGGFIFDASARALGCAVIPSGPGNTEAQFELIEAYRPVGYSGTPDFLKILLDAAASAGRNVSSIQRALVSGAAFPRSLQNEIRSRGVDAYQAFGTADLGMVAFETTARDGMVVNEDLILEIVKPGTGDPVADGDVGEIVVTSLDPHHPLDSPGARRSHRGAAGRKPLRPHQYAHQGLDGPRRSDHQGQGHVRAAGTGRRDRQTPPRTRTAAPGSLCAPARTDVMTLKARMRRAERGASRPSRRNAANRGKNWRQCRTGLRRRAAERRQGDCGRTRLTALMLHLPQSTLWTLSVPYAIRRTALPQSGGTGRSFESRFAEFSTLEGELSFHPVAHAFRDGGGRHKSVDQPGFNPRSKNPPTNKPHRSRRV